MKPAHVAFCDIKLEKEFEALSEGRFPDRRLFEDIGRAIVELKKDPACGRRIPKRLWPRVYVRKYALTNLWKYDLPKAWRLIYTIQIDDVMILSVILEWFDHKEYERRFNY